MRRLASATIGGFALALLSTDAQAASCEALRSLSIPQVTITSTEVVNWACSAP
jgi:hypothetical protein